MKFIKVVMALMLFVTLGACGSEDATALEAIEYNKQYESLSFSNLDIPVHVEEIDGITYADGVLIVNKEIPLPSDYNPGLQAETEEAYLQMFEDAAAEGYLLNSSVVLDLTIIKLSYTIIM